MIGTFFRHGKNLVSFDFDHDFFNKFQKSKLEHMRILIQLILLISLVYQSQAQHNVETLAIGKHAPDFNLPGIDGKNYSLKDFSQYKILTVIFSCNHCPTAQAYEDKIIRAVKDYRPEGVGFVVINPNNTEALSLAELGYTDMGDTMEEMKQRARDKDFNFPYLFDGDTEKTSIAYGPVATPHVFIFDEDRKLRYTGRIDDTENPYIEPHEQDMRNALDALLAGKEVPVKVTKTFGCSIKWAWKDEWTKKLLEDWAKAPVNIEEINVEGLKSLVKNDGDKLRLINFWATWCGPCVIEFPEFVAIDRMYRGRDFEFVSVSADKLSKKDKALDFLKKKEAANANYIFSGTNTYNMIDAVDPDWQGALPYTILVAPGGKIIYKSQGPIESLQLKKDIVGYLGRYYADDK